MYLVTEFYSPESEAGLRFSDPSLKIEWPLSVTDISVKDAGHQLLDKNFRGMNL